MVIENRSFVRYPGTSGLIIVREGRALRASTVDYCLSGVGVELKEKADLKPGDTVTLDMAKPRLKSSGTVVWTEQTPAGMKAGISRTGLLYGSLEDFLMPDILLGLQRSGKTGIFHTMEPEKTHRSIHFLEGDMVFASSNRPAERFGEMLVERGAVTPIQLERARDLMKSSDNRLGGVLAEMGVFTPEELVNAIRSHVEGIILRIIRTKDAEFMFKEGPLDSQESVTLRLSAANLIYSGIRGITEEDHLMRFSPAGDRMLQFAEDPLDLYQDLRLDEQGRAVMSLVDGSRTTDELLEDSPSGRRETLSALAALLATRIVEARDPSVAEGPGVKAEEVLRKEADASSGEFVARVEELYRDHESLGFYRVLGIPESASLSDIKKAYYSRAREFHPDKHYRLPDDLKEKLNAVFTSITTAYTTLSNPELRSSYDRRPAAAAPVGRQDPAAMAEERFKEGTDAFREARFGDAARLFGEAAYLQGGEHRYHFHAGCALARAGKLKDAERALQRALRADPFNADYLAEVGHVFLALNMPLRARGSFEKALKTQAGHRRALEGLDQIPE